MREAFFNEDRLLASAVTAVWAFAVSSPLIQGLQRSAFDRAARASFRIDSDVGGITAIRDVTLRSFNTLKLPDFSKWGPVLAAVNAGYLRGADAGQVLKAHGRLAESHGVGLKGLLPCS